LDNTYTNTALTRPTVSSSSLSSLDNTYTNTALTRPTVSFGSILSNEISVCGPKVNDTSCTLPDTNICGASGTDCDPHMGKSIYSAYYTPNEAAKQVATIIGDRLLERCRPGGASIESLTSTSVWETFTLIFSYEYWSAPGPPLWLLGNPEKIYNATMWSEFVSEFRIQLAIKLQQQPQLSGGLCQTAAHTLPRDIRIGCYWARRALEAWGAPSKDPIVDFQYMQGST